MSYIGSKPANKPVVASDLDPTVITGQTALATSPASTDEFLISDAGVLKRLDASLIGGTNTPNFEASKSDSNQAISNNSTTTVVLGLVLANIHTTAVTASVQLDSNTANRNGANNVANGVSQLVKNVTIPSGSSLELLSGGKVVLEATDAIKIDCSVADKLSGTLSIMEIT